MVKVVLLSSALAMAMTMTMTPTSATVLNFINRCSFEVDVQHSQLAATFTSIGKIASKGSMAYTADGPAHAFRHGSDNAATMAEFSIPAGQPWYDISIIPPMPGWCTGYDDCRSVTGSAGFNVAMNIEPLSNINDANCRVLRCASDDPNACSDAYLFPDDTKTHDCPAGTDFNVIFCPNEPDVAPSPQPETPSPPAPTSPPSTPAPETQAPGTVMPEPPTTQAPAPENTPAPAVTEDGVLPGNVEPAGPSASAGAVKGVYSYKGKYAGNVPGGYDKVVQLDGCVKEHVTVNNPVGPLSEGVSMVFRGPMDIYDIGVYMPSGDSWNKVSSYSNGGSSDNLVFMNNKNIDYSGQGAHGPQGFATADGLGLADAPQQFGGSLKEATDVANIYGGPGISSGAEVNIMTGEPCAGSCSAYAGDNDYKGWVGGRKIFVTKVKMPQGSAPNQPAIWMLNSKVLWSNQYGCNCRGMGAPGGCGELDIAEVIETNPARDRVSTHYYFYDGTINAPNGDNWAPRPTDAATVYVTIIDSNGEGLVKIVQLDDFDFGGTISADTYAKWLSA